MAAVSSFVKAMHAIDTDKIYVLTTPTNPEDVADGVQFIVDTSNAYSALVTAYTKAEQYVDGGSLVFTDADASFTLPAGVRRPF